MNGKNEKIAIIGAGPAGIAAAIYLKRAGHEPLLLEKERVGGLLLNANLVENYPGFPNGISGKSLVKRFERQLKRLKIKPKKCEIKQLVPEKNGIKIYTGDGTIEAKIAIVATGTRPLEAGIRGEATMAKKGKLFYEIRNLPKLRGRKKFAVIGSGDAAFDYALHLAEKGQDVTIISKNPKPNCLPLLVKRARINPRIGCIFNRLAVEIKDGKNGLWLECRDGQNKSIVPADFVLVAVGREPNIEVLQKDVRESLELKESGRTNFEGIYIVGDAIHGKYRQVGISVGNGILAAMEIERTLNRESE